MPSVPVLVQTKVVVQERQRLLKPKAHLERRDLRRRTERPRHVLEAAAGPLGPHGFARLQQQHPLREA